MYFDSIRFNADVFFLPSVCVCSCVVVFLFHFSISKQNYKLCNTHECEGILVNYYDNIIYMFVTVAIDCNLLSCIVHNSFWNQTEHVVPHPFFPALSRCFLIHAIYFSNKEQSLECCYILHRMEFALNFNNDLLLMIEIPAKLEIGENAFTVMDCCVVTTTTNSSTGFDNGIGRTVTLYLYSTVHIQCIIIKHVI